MTPPSIPKGFLELLGVDSSKCEVKKFDTASLSQKMLKDVPPYRADILHQLVLAKSMAESAIQDVHALHNELRKALAKWYKVRLKAPTHVFMPVVLKEPYKVLLRSVETYGIQAANILTLPQPETFHGLTIIWAEVEVISVGDLT